MRGQYKFEDLSSKILNAAVNVHKQLGPGFLESIYEEALCCELSKQGIAFERQKEIKVYYDNHPVGTHRLDLLVNKEIVVELKAVQEFEKAHFATVKSYLRATNLHVGLLLNFNKVTLEIKRMVY
jgi:GxxExxY protein